MKTTDTVINSFNDPYARRFTVKNKRSEFEKLKKTPEFRKWKNRQMRIQKAKCAYCKVDLRKGNIVVHVDHIDPLYFEGTNDFSNLVLSCRRCNTRKWINNRIVRPDWIKERDTTVMLQEQRIKQKKLMRELVDKELDIQILNSDLSWLQNL